jgi:SAM-dependent methyltransferase
MREEVINLLNNLNRTFYDELAEVFAASRGAAEPGLERVFAQMQPGVRVLDLGCGQGRVTAMLPAGCEYVGLDFSTEMLAIAERSTNMNLPPIASRFVVGDLLNPEWSTLLPVGRYDWVILRAVLHHIPGAKNRQAIVVVLGCRGLATR